MNKETTAIIDIGGGMRGIYAAGVLDYLNDHKICADVCIGVSAGSANLANYLAGQRGRTYLFYHEYAFRKKYGSLRNFFFKGAYFDFDYIFSDLSEHDGENPLDTREIEQSDSTLVTVATNVLTGRPAYFFKNRLAADNLQIFKGSCAIPYLCHPWTIANVPYCDGTVSDPIPIEKAQELGAQKTIILCPRRPEKTASSMGLRLYSVLSCSKYGKTYPRVGESLKRRQSVNDQSVHRIEALEKQGKALILSPKNLHDVHSIRASRKALDELYLEGYQDGKIAAAFLAGGKETE